MGKTATAIRHVAFEDLGTLSALLSERGFAIEYLDVAPGVSLRTADESELLVVLGGPIGAYEEEAYPFVTDELRLLERRLAAERPTLGICLGAQLMARALGAEVYAGGRKELGWSPLTLTDAGRGSCLRHLEAALTQVLHWHGDTFGLPAGAELLASSALYVNQAFAWKSHGLAVQFHLEASASALERWYIGHACELAGAQISVPALRRDSAVNAEPLERVARLCFTDWLNTVCG